MPSISPRVMQAQQRSASGSAPKSSSRALGPQSIGSLAGEPYEGGGVPSNWLSTSITFGVGEVTGNTGSNEYELVFQQKLTLGTKVPITGGTFYVHDPHPLASQYVCIRSGEIALVKAPPTDSVLIEFTISSAVLGRNCDGAPVDVALDGCLSRGSTYVP